MKLIIWLWNPWKQYELTRHNLGFLFVDFLLKEEQFENFKYESKFKWDLSIWKISWEKVILFKPTTFMNLSWEAIKLITSFYKIDTQDILIIYDDISMDFWKIRLRENGSAWGHNWIKSIINHFWNDFNRIKIWIWYDKKYEVSDWVLSKFTKDEVNELNNSIYIKTYDFLIDNIFTIH